MASTQRLARVSSTVLPSWSLCWELACLPGRLPIRLPPRWPTLASVLSITRPATQLRLVIEER